MFHFIQNMPVNIQGKGGGGMAHVFLYGLNVILLERKHCVSMPQIVETNIRQVQLFHDSLKAVIHRPIGENAPGGISEHESGFFPCLPGVQTVPVLL